jgi:hypothetical protein
LSSVPLVQILKPRRGASPDRVAGSAIESGAGGASTAQANRTKRPFDGLPLASVLRGTYAGLTAVVMLALTIAETDLPCFIVCRGMLA